MDTIQLVRHGAVMPQRRFGLYLRGLIEERGWSQERAAVILGVSEGLLSMLISGKARPNLGKVREWKVALGLPEREYQVLYRLALLARSPTEVEEEHLRLLGSVTPYEEPLPDE